MTGRRILHLVPVWSRLSGVAFQKKRMNWTQTNIGSFEMRCVRLQTAFRPSTLDCFSTVPSSPSLMPSWMWLIVVAAPEPP